MDEKFANIIIDGIETNYSISSLGYVINVKSGKILVPEISKSGYYRLGIYYRDENNNICHKKVLIHRLVAIVFIPNPKNFPEVNHIDGDKSHNYESNLEWVTTSYNEYHAYANNLKKKKYGDESHLHKFLKNQVIKACELMECGCYTTREISKITGVSNAMLRRIYKRKSWCNISESYNVENCKQEESRNDGSRYSREQMETAFRLLSENKLSLYDISNISGVRTSTLSNIINHRSGLQQYESLYDVYNVDGYSGRKPVLHPLSEDDKERIKFLLSIGNSEKEVSHIMNHKYGFNEDYILHYIQRNFNRIYT